MATLFDLVGLDASENQATFVFQFRAASGESLSIEVPADNFLGVAPELMQLMRSALLQKQAGALTTRGTFQQTALLEPTTVHVETVPISSPPSVALVVDRGLPTEFGYRFSLVHAKELVDRLLSKIQLSTQTDVKH